MVRDRMNQKAADFCRIPADCGILCIQKCEPGSEHMFLSAVRIEDPLRVPRHDRFPVSLQLWILLIPGEDRPAFKVADKAVSVVKQDGYAVPAVARRGDDLSVDPHAAEEDSAV